MPRFGGLVHLFVIGWVCVTIMGALTQFIPVWSGTTLRSRRLASAQLALGGGRPVGSTALARVAGGRFAPRRAVGWSADRADADDGADDDCGEDSI